MRQISILRGCINLDPPCSPLLPQGPSLSQNFLVSKTNSQSSTCVSLPEALLLALPPLSHCRQLRCHCKESDQPVRCGCWRWQAWVAPSRPSINGFCQAVKIYGRPHGAACFLKGRAYPRTLWQEIVVISIQRMSQKQPQPAPKLYITTLKRRIMKQMGTHIGNRCRV